MGYSYSRWQRLFNSTQHKVSGSYQRGWGDHPNRRPSPICPLVSIVTVLFSRVTAGGKGSQAGIKMGEQIVEINGQATADLVHVAAQKLIKNTGVNLELTLNRSAATSKGVLSVK